MKYIVWIFIFVTAIIGFGYIKGDPVIQNVTIAITGHVEDAISRTTDDEIVETMNLSKSGIFDETADGQDLAHWATGSVSIVQGEDGKWYVQLNSDFNSGPLPDGHVYISLIDSDINNESDFNFDTQIDLGPLKKGSGASYYEIPNTLPASLIKSVTIWCKAFGEYIGSADIS